MGWKDAPIVRTAPAGIEKPIQPNEMPGFKAAVEGATTAASERVKAGLKPTTEAETAAATAKIPTPAIYQELAADQSITKSILGQVNRAKELYNKSLKGQEPWRVAREYFPGAFKADPIASDVKRFNTAASQLYSLGSRLTRVAGEGSQDRMEFAQKLEAFKPSSDDSDAVIEEKILGLENLVNSRLQFLNSRLGDVKPATPNINRAKAMMGAGKSKTIYFDKNGNRIK